MKNKFEHRINALASRDREGVLHGGRFGIEKESLRVTQDGLIAHSPHPSGFGSALTNRYITTDYSEALIELVTPPLGSSWEVIQFLCGIHQFIHPVLGDELLWPVSMPCMIRSEADIPLANYGSSNVGQMKTVYRRGLGYRYGRYMQAISGIHFNYSLPDLFWPHYQEVENSTDDLQDFRSSAYLGLVRNVRRLDWLLLYLFGSSPAVCKSFFAGAETDLVELDSGTYHGPHATSLRMSGIGYQNKNQAALNVSADSLDAYIRDMTNAVRTLNEQYRKIGVKVGSEYRQLNANDLQIENEYYSTIRPKRVAESGEWPTEALRRGGVEYVELRALDVSPFDPVGINQAQVKFLEIFSIYCLLADSPPITTGEQHDNVNNHALVAGQGRKPGLSLRRRGSTISLQDWGREICEEIRGVAELLEQGGGDGYVDIVEAQMDAIADPNLTPSARLISDLRETRQSMFQYGMQLSHTYAEYFREMTIDVGGYQEALQEESRESVKRQAEIESADDVSFDEYLERYFA
jgi:glutamate--cysteine ligase